MEFTDQPATNQNDNTPTNNSGNDSDVSTKVRSIDTVKALHDTVTTLRLALEESRNEVLKLKRQILVITEIDQKYKKREQKASGKSISSRSRPLINKKKQSKLRELRKTTTVSSAIGRPSKINKDSRRIHTNNEQNEIVSVVPIASNLTQASEFPGMASRIDVKIKVTSNVQVDGCSGNSSSEDGEQIESSKHTGDEHESEDVGENSDDTKVNDEKPTINPDTKADNPVHMKVSSSEKLNVIKTSDKIRVTQSSTENLHLDVDNISQNSISEGDNSVFADNVQQKEPPSAEERNSNAANKVDPANKISKDSMDQTEEVDDIDLIFSSDDNNKDIINQEDLVSISEYELWQQSEEASTPILVNFKKITSDAQTDSDDKENIGRQKCRKTNRARSEDHQQKSLESSDSFSFDNSKHSLDFNAKSSSLDKDTSLEQPEASEGGMCRDESFDTFESEQKNTNTRKWTNFNVLIETDISKCGIHDDNVIDMGRRNTCPNPTPYRPILHTTQARSQGRNPLAVKFGRSPRNYISTSHNSPNRQSTRPLMSDSCRMGPKMCSSAQTDITALPQYWRSETQLTDGQYPGLYTLPSKFTPPRYGHGRSPLRPAEKTQEARRVLLSDINFTSMVPELSRSADHLCHEKFPNSADHHHSQSYYKGNQLKTPDYASRGMTSNFSMSPNVSQWTVNETSFGTQTPYGNRGDSFDSIGSRSMGSRHSSTLSRIRSRSVPSMRYCVICRQNHGLSNLRTSESMHYGTKVQFQEPLKTNVRGSLPDLRHVCSCSKRYGKPSLYRIHVDSAGSTDSLLEEAEEYLRHSMEGLGDDGNTFGSTRLNKSGHRRCSENDILKDYTPSKESLPFLPKSSNCLKPGHLAKVITKNGRVVVGRVRYVGPMAGGEDEFYIGLELQNSFGDCDGTVDGRRFFDCQPQHGIFVPFKKIVMAWNS